MITNISELFGDIEVENNHIFPDHNLVKCDKILEAEDLSYKDDTNIYVTNIRKLKWEDSNDLLWEHYLNVINKGEWNMITDGLSSTDKVNILIKKNKEAANKVFPLTPLTNLLSSR